jgi:hypothetical protein
MNRNIIAILLAGLLDAHAAAEPPEVVGGKPVVHVQISSTFSPETVKHLWDADADTRWQTPWGPNHVYPHEVVMDLGAPRAVTRLAYLKARNAHGAVKDYEVFAGADPTPSGAPVARGSFTDAAEWQYADLSAPVRARYVVLRCLSPLTPTAGHTVSSIAELRAFAADALLVGPDATFCPPEPIPQTELGAQYEALAYDLRQRRTIQGRAAETFRPEALIAESDRDPLDIVLRRTAALLADLDARHGKNAERSALAGRLAALQKESDKVTVFDGAGRYRLYERACGVRRRIAFTNPLVNFDALLFITRKRGRTHMCDQYYGDGIPPGGGMYVLSGAFGEKPEVRDVLAETIVEEGRLKGQRLEGGSFLSPDLSFDARKIAFAYVECKGPGGHVSHTDPARGHWHQERCYHVFTVNADGTHLQQITDGTWNDFDPCWLPNGRLAFITERRGGYLRCGRACPTYTLYDMAAGGGDKRPLSVHETNEWNPSVTHDGRIIYTRWDYVDRHGCTVHLPWIITPDGRDSRAMHGNFAPRSARPDMELDCRAIPNSPRYAATAAPHHGHAFGSLVVIDPRVQDDDRMAPVRRLTPEVGFPESQGGTQTYGTPWPLGEDYYLCVYDPREWGSQSGQFQARVGHYGIYLLDSFGNKELIYRDPAVPCQSPIPLRPRPTPPAAPSPLPPLANAVRQAGTEQVLRVDGKSAEGVFAVIDVYDSLKPWPAGTTIKSLRVYQIVPMSVPSGGPPHEIGLRERSSGDSVNLARAVLGTVPVEADGSAHFFAPAHREMFFQALDERGLAVQSMRSAAYLQPGERLTCQGCHEPRGQAPKTPPSPPLALQRGPSRIEPDVDGGNPFSYPRLVQPVLDKHCVACHAKNVGKAPPLDRSIVKLGRTDYYASFASLAPKYGFHDYGNGQRTIPGRFGARASKLLELLEKGHYDVRLPAEDLHRITLWLDSLSNFYGVYEKEGGLAQLRGEIVRPTLE